MGNRRPIQSSHRRFRDQPRIVVWCAWKNCGLSVPASCAFCTKHLRAVFALMREKGVLRPDDELIPVALRPAPNITKS